MSSYNNSPTEPAWYKEHNELLKKLNNDPASITNEELELINRYNLAKQSYKMFNDSQPKLIFPEQALNCNPILPLQDNCNILNIQQYLTQFEHALMSQNINMDLWTHFILKHVSNITLNFLHSKNITDSTSWNSVKSLLLERFLDNKSIRRNIIFPTKLSNINDILLHSEKMICNFKDGNTEDLTITQIFLSYPTQLQEYISTRINIESVKLSEFMSFIYTNFNQLIDLSNSNKRKPHENTQIVSSKNFYCSHCKKSGHSDERCWFKNKPNYMANNKKINNFESDQIVSKMNTILIKVENTPNLKCSLDTGAESNFISKKIIQSNNFPINYSNQNLYEVGNATRKFPIIGDTDPLIIEGHNGIKVSTTFHVIENLPYNSDIILCKATAHLLNLHSQMMECSETEIRNAGKIVSNKNEFFSYSKSIDQLLNQNKKLNTFDCYSNINNEVALNVGNIQPIGLPQRPPIPRALYESVDDIIKNLLNDGRIKETSKNEWCLPIIIVEKKKEGKVTGHRLCLNPKPLNKHIIYSEYRIPKISEMIYKLSGCSIYSKLDLKDSFLQIPLKKEDRIKTTFKWKEKYYNFIGAPFGIKHLTYHMQKIMEKTLNGLENFAMPYIDDIIIFSKSEKEHILHIEKVISAITNAKLKLNTEKCEFFKKEIKALGHIINQNGHRIDDENIKKATEFPIPRTGRQIQSFLGITNFARSYVQNYAEIAAPLDELRNVKKFKKNTWTSEHQNSFNTLKTALGNAIRLSFPLTNEPFILETDASKYAISAVLIQMHGNEKRIVDMKARKLNKTEMRYSAHKRELLAILFGFKKFHEFLYGRKFNLHCDNLALSYLNKDISMTAVEAGWIDQILNYDFEVKHINGVDNVIADGLSRILNTEETETSPETIHIFNLTLTEELTDAEKQEALHRTHLKGHFCAEQLHKQLRKEGLNWMNMKKDCIEFSKKCTQCQMYNPGRTGYHPIKQISAAEAMDHIAIDLAGPFPESKNGNQYILVIYDYHTKFIQLYAIKNKEAQHVANSLIKSFCTFGFPKILQTDNGTEFINHLIHCIKEQCGIEHRIISPYYPQANGGVERSIATIKKILGIMTEGNENDWEFYINSTQYFMNQAIHSAHNCSPFEVMFARSGSNFQNYKDVNLNEISEAEIEQKMQEIKNFTRPMINEFTEKYQKRVKAQYNKQNKIRIQTLLPGTQVYIAIPSDLKTSLSPKFEGPYTVKRRTTAGNYELLNYNGKPITRRYPLGKLKVVDIQSESNIPQNDSGTIEKIVNHSGEPNRYTYEIKWKNKADEFNSFLTKSDIPDIRILRKYWSKVNKNIKQNSQEISRAGGG